MKKPKRILKPEKYPLLSKKSNQFIDRIVKVSKIEFPETLTFNEGYISEIKCKILWEKPPAREYLEMEIVIRSHFVWKRILVMMTIEELNLILKKSYYKRYFKFFKNILKQKECSFRDGFDSYFHCKGFDLTVLQIINTEIAKEVNNQYYTHDLLKLAS
jgi:hypothetical protein